MNPYENLPEDRFWRNAVVQSSPQRLVDIHTPKWPIEKNDLFVTMGSCFAQHIGNSLRKQGLNVPFFDTNQNIRSQSFSANYGNVYTTRQALQLVEEAMGRHSPSEIAWQVDGGFIDALRPNVFSNPVRSVDEIIRLRKLHLASVVKALSSLNILVFTLGLTETWLIKSCGTALPTAPGVIGGQFDAERYEFMNMSYSQVLGDLEKLVAQISELRAGEPFKVLLTVSPVPLTATAEKRHVLQSSAYSKSVLRAVAGDFTAQRDNVDYFPSFEIITNPSARTHHFEENLRSVKDESVAVVMEHFNRAYFGSEVMHSDGSQEYESGADCKGKPCIKRFELAGTTVDERQKPSVDRRQVTLLDDGLDECGDVDCEEALLEQFAVGHPEPPLPVSTAKILFFGNSHLGLFKNCITDKELLENSVFVPLNFLASNPFKDLQKNHFKRFQFTRSSPFNDVSAPDLEYLCIVGFGIFGDGIIRSLGAVLPGSAGCNGADISPQLDIVTEVDEACIKKFEESILYRLGRIKLVAEHTGFKKIWWVVSPDFSVDVARFRLSDDFVDSGAYKVYKQAYETVFWRLVETYELDIQFIFHDEDQYCQNSGFVARRYSGNIAWDIHVRREFFAAKALYLEGVLGGRVLDEHGKMVAMQDM